MPSPYRALFAEPGTKGFAVAGFVGRMPLSMMGIGVITMISQLTGRYGLAGALTATIALSAAVLGPQISRLVDRYGQRRVLRPATLVALGAATGLLLAAHFRWPDWTLFVFSAAIGSVPSLGAMVRARWAALYGGTPKLHTAYSFESVVDEVCFIVGPIVSVGLSTAWFPEAGPLLAACFLAVGVFWLTAQRATEPVPHPRDENHVGGSVLRSKGLQVLVAAFAATGTIFGAVDVATVAFAEERGHKGAASVVLAVYAAGSCTAGLVFGLLRFAGRPERRWVLGLATMAVSMIPLLLVGNLPLLAVALFVAGLSVAPTMITTMSLIEEHVPRANLTEGMTWVGTGLAVGVALGSSAAGWVIDAAGARAGYGVPAAAGAVAVAVGFLGYRRLSRPAAGRGGTVEQHGEREARHVA
ncbi:MFS transporter [Streptomyces sp. DSM 110735]|uniref:MFS transporter n=1 Tax=Streptomyces sp. DSM 110735 TaxID=2775031 RepID=UPI0018F49B77|nr:MFS transporter [Streptomyces sp. DSM 110735]MBJ7903768.1 MFS transporter [Streptomyces sp. DSM 110735]